MDTYRIHKHPILNQPSRNVVHFFWQGQSLNALTGETIASALIANGIHIFGYHPKDSSPQGIFCANGQCAQCMVLANGYPVKACTELITPGMVVKPLRDLPELPEENNPPLFHLIEEICIPVLIIGGGPAGLSAAIELGKQNIPAILIDDKHRVGGKLVLQTHRFFGSVKEVYAGTRGIDIATKLENEVLTHPSVQIWLHSTALAVFSDNKVGILREGNKYVLVNPETLLVASGAREKSLAFKGNTLPGVYGAGAFQTLVNRDLVRPCDNIFIVGGGNVGLITGYHALQAGINVIGLVEALPECGGYKVHKDKLTRFGVPIYTSHTILSANGQDHVSSVTIAQVNEKFQPLPGSEKSFECDSILIAVGLDPVNEFFLKAKDFGLPVFAAGDAEEIAEASAAMISGKIKGVEISRYLGYHAGNIPEEWYQTSTILRSKPGKMINGDVPELTTGITPVIHCTQEIPCDPCSALCKLGLISIDKNDIRQVPSFIGSPTSCKLCKRCLIGCPGLAITLVDFRSEPDNPQVLIPYEFNKEVLQTSNKAIVSDTQGLELAELEIIDVITAPNQNKTVIIKVKAPKDIALKIAGVRIQNPTFAEPMSQTIIPENDETIICRCERVTVGELRALIRKGYRDINEIKSVSRAGMGACGAKTCNLLLQKLFREEGINPSDITEQTKRPLFIEVPLGLFAGSGVGEKGN